MKHWFQSGIFRRIILSILAVSLVPLLILGALALRTGNEAGTESIAQSRQALDAKSGEALELRAIETADAIARFLEEREGDLRMLALLPRDAQTYLAFAQAHQGEMWYLDGERQVRQRTPLYREVAYVDATGQEVIKITDGQVALRGELRDVSDPANTTFKSETYFAEASRLPPGEIYVGHVTGFYVSKAEFEQGKRFEGVLRFAMPIYDEEEQFDGIVVIALDSRHLAEFTDHIVASEEHFAVVPDPADGNYAYMIDDLAGTLAHPNEYLLWGVGPDGETLPYASRPEELGTLPVRLDKLGFMDENLASIHGKVAQGQPGSIQYFWDEKDKFVAYAPIPYYGGAYQPPAGFGWVGIGAEVKTFHRAADLVGQTIQAKVREMGMLTLTVLVMTTAIVLLVAGWQAQQVSAPIQRLIEAARAVEHQNFRLDMLDPLLGRPPRDEIGQLARVFRGMADHVKKREQYRRLLDTVIDIGVALPQEKDFNRLLERVVLEAKSLCSADGATLYLHNERDELEFVILRNDTLNIAMGGTTGQPIPYSPIPLYDKDGQPNHKNVVSHTVHCAGMVHIPDAYQTEEFDFSGTRAYDKKTGYYSRSFLSIPLMDASQDIVGVLQLINAKDPQTGELIDFEEGMNRVVESLAALGTVALKAYMREMQLQQKIAALQIEIDMVRQDQQVAEITETEYFQNLQRKARYLREKKRTST